MKKDELQKIIEQAIVEDYFPPKYQIVSVSKKEVSFNPELQVKLSDFGENLRTELLKARQILKISVTKPKALNEQIELIAFDVQKETKSFKYEDEAEDFPKIEFTTLKVVPSHSRTFFIIRMSEKNKIEIYRIGGDDHFQSKASNSLLPYILKAAQGKDHTAKDFEFNNSTMYRILSGLAENVGYIKVNPRHNDRFVKVMAEAGKTVGIENVEYYISDIEFRGYKITKSPGLIELLQQRGIIIDEIIGKWKFESEPITLWIRRNGRVSFYIPGKLAQNESVARDLAIKYFSELEKINEKNTDINQGLSAFFEI